MTIILVRSVRPLLEDRQAHVYRGLGIEEGEGRGRP
jgi:hypothetical protein